MSSLGKRGREKGLLGQKSRDRFFEAHLSSNSDDIAAQEVRAVWLKHSDS